MAFLRSTVHNLSPVNNLPMYHRLLSGLFRGLYQVFSFFFIIEPSANVVQSYINNDTAILFLRPCLILPAKQHTQH